MAERERERSWREILVSATSNPAASSTASPWMGVAAISEELALAPFMASSIYLVVIN
jgi:hypothetical protein